MWQRRTRRFCHSVGNRLHLGTRLGTRCFVILPETVRIQEHVSEYLAEQAAFVILSETVRV